MQTLCGLNRGIQMLEEIGVEIRLIYSSNDVFLLAPVPPAPIGILFAPPLLPPRGVPPRPPLPRGVPPRDPVTRGQN